MNAVKFLRADSESESVIAVLSADSESASVLVDFESVIAVTLLSAVNMDLLLLSC